MALRSINALERRRLHLAAFACALALLTSSGIGAAKGEGLFSIGDDSDPKIASAIGDELGSGLLDKKVPADPTRSAPRDQMRLQLKDFYAARDNRPAWTGGDDALSHAKEASEALAHAYEQGLKPSDYLSYLGAWNTVPHDGPEAAKFDVAMTEAVLIYALDVHAGRYAPWQVYKDATLPPRHFDAAAALNAGLRRDSLAPFFANLPPVHPGYRYLAAALARYRAVAAKGGWPVVRGANDTKALTTRLALEDPADADALSGDDLHDAVTAFQKRSGLPDDGTVGPDTLAALNVPAKARVNEIIANMERWRWVPEGFERRYVLVNVPDQSVQFVDDGESQLYSKVIIGKQRTPTPILRTEVIAVVANPPWDIPDDIAAHKLSKGCRTDSDCLASHHMTMATAEDGTYGLQQLPGDDNALGKIMIDAPNDYGVYMHDTPNKKLFDASVREFSNGCIRTQRIFELATLVMGMDADDPNSTLTDAIATGQTQRLALNQPLPVYVLYWTAAAYSDGSVHFRPDRYGRDALLIAKMGDTGKPAAAKPGKAPKHGKPSKSEIVAAAPGAAAAAAQAQ
jgi:murein L,D-transpeptidase YcbB/YkuD